MNNLGKVFSSLFLATVIVLVSAAEDATNTNEEKPSMSNLNGLDDAVDVDKRYAKSGFIGSRGKKLRSAFFGMRGRRTDPNYPVQWSEYETQNGEANSGNSDQEYPRHIQSDFSNDMSAVRQREQLGAYGQYMLKRYDDSFNGDQYYPTNFEDSPEKRAMRYNQFLGMRGKKLRNSAFLGMRGKKSDEGYNSAIEQKLSEILESRNQPFSGAVGSKRGEYRGNAFFGMRG